MSPSRWLYFFVVDWDNELLFVRTCDLACSLENYVLEVQQSKHVHRSVGGITAAIELSGVSCLITNHLCRICKMRWFQYTQTRKVCKQTVGP